MWGEIYDRIAELALQHRSTLVFVNTRRLAERVAHHLGERLGKDAVAAHHGSLSRKLRLAAERKLKAGEVRVLVATASLELGIDIGTVDLVCQIGSPRSIAVALQRIGRAGHWRGAMPKGRIFATTRDELLECAALVRAVRRGELDRLIIPEAPLDVLAQQIVAACAAEDWREDDLFALVRRAYPYRDLPRADFDAMLTMLSEGIAARRGRYGAYLFRDRVNGTAARHGAAAASRPSPAAARFRKTRSTPWWPRRKTLWSARWTKTSPSKAWRRHHAARQHFLAHPPRASAAACWSKTRKARRPTCPSGAAKRPRAPRSFPSRSPSCARRSANWRLRRRMAKMPPRVSPTPWLGSSTNAAWTMRGAEQAVRYVLAGRAVLGAVPSQELIIAERFFDESGGMQLVIHAPFGARINKAWGLALRKRFCRSFNFELQAAATDNGLNISLGEQHSFPLADVFHFLHADSVQEVLEQAVLASPLFRRALALGRRTLAGAAALSRRQESSAADSAHARRRSAGRRFSRKRSPARKISSATSRFPIIRWSAKP